MDYNLLKNVIFEIYIIHIDLIVLKDIIISYYKISTGIRILYKCFKGFKNFL